MPLIISPTSRSIRLLQSSAVLRHDCTCRRALSTTPAATLGLQPLLELLLISHPAEGRRLSWPHSRLATSLRLLAVDGIRLEAATATAQLPSPILYHS